MGSTHSVAVLPPVISVYLNPIKASCEPITEGDCIDKIYITKLCKFDAHMTINEATRILEMIDFSYSLSDTFWAEFKALTKNNTYDDCYFTHCDIKSGNTVISNDKKYKVICTGAYYRNCLYDTRMIYICILKIS